MNPYKFQVVCYYNDATHGTHNRIVASAATLKGCLSDYRRFLQSYEIGKIHHNAIKTLFLCDGVQFNIETMEG